MSSGGGETTELLRMLRGGGGQEGGLAQASTQEVELRQWVWWDRRLLWAGPCFSSLPFQVFQQEKEGDEVGVGQGAE